MGPAVSLMGLNQARVGVQVSAVESVVLPIITLLNLALAMLLLRNVQTRSF